MSLVMVAGERYDDVREAMVREKSIFLAGGAWWEEPPAAFRSKPPSLRGRRSCRRTRECGRPIAAAACGSCGIWNRLNAASSTAAGSLKNGTRIVSGLQAREKCARRC